MALYRARICSWSWSSLKGKEPLSAYEENTQKTWKQHNSSLLLDHQVFKTGCWKYRLWKTYADSNFMGTTMVWNFVRNILLQGPSPRWQSPKRFSSTLLISDTSCNIREGKLLRYHRLIGHIPSPAPWQYLFWYMSQGWPICLISLISPSRISIWSFACAKQSSRSLFPLIWTPSPYFNS